MGWELVVDMCLSINICVHPIELACTHNVLAQIAVIVHYTFM